MAAGGLRRLPVGEMRRESGFGKKSFVGGRMLQLSLDVGSCKGHARVANCRGLGLEGDRLGKADWAMREVAIRLATEPNFVACLGFTSWPAVGLGLSHWALNWAQN